SQFQSTTAHKRARRGKVLGDCRLFGVNLFLRVLRSGCGLHPISVFVKEYPDGFARNHFTGSTARAVHGPHGARAHRFAEELDLQPAVTAWAAEVIRKSSFQWRVNATLSKERVARCLILIGSATAGGRRENALTVLSLDTSVDVIHAFFLR